MRNLLAAFGFLIAIISVFFVIAAISDIVAGDSPTSTGILLGLMIFFLGIALGGLFMAMTAIKKNRYEKQKRKEELVIQAIITHKGTITPIELAAETKFTLDESNDILDSLCGRGFGSVSVTDQGNIVYSFKSSLSKEERNSLSDIFHE